MKRNRIGIESAQKVITLLLVIAGLSLLTAAAWCIAFPLGLAAAGVSCLVLEWRVGERAESDRRPG